jgi:hypothetical protein
MPPASNRAAYECLIALADHARELLRELVDEWNVSIDGGERWTIKVREGDNVATLLFGDEAKKAKRRGDLDRLAGSTTIRDLVSGMRTGKHLIDDYSVALHVVLIACVRLRAALPHAGEDSEATPLPLGPATAGAVRAVKRLGYIVQHNSVDKTDEIAETTAFGSPEESPLCYIVFSPASQTDTHQRESYLAIGAPKLGRAAPWGTTAEVMRLVALDRDRETEFFTLQDAPKLKAEREADRESKDISSMAAAVISEASRVSEKMNQYIAFLAADERAKSSAAAFHESQMEKTATKQYDINILTNAVDAMNTVMNKHGFNSNRRSEFRKALSTQPNYAEDIVSLATAKNAARDHTGWVRSIEDEKARLEKKLSSEKTGRSTSRKRSFSQLDEISVAVQCKADAELFVIVRKHITPASASVHPVGSKVVVGADRDLVATVESYDGNIGRYTVSFGSIPDFTRWHGSGEAATTYHSSSVTSVQDSMAAWAREKAVEYMKQLGISWQSGGRADTEVSHWQNNASFGEPRSHEYMSLPIETGLTTGVLNPRPSERTAEIHKTHMTWLECYNNERVCDDNERVSKCVWCGATVQSSKGAAVVRIKETDAVIIQAIDGQCGHTPGNEQAGSRFPSGTRILYKGEKHTKRATVVDVASDESDGYFILDDPERGTKVVEKKIQESDIIAYGAAPVPRGFDGELYMPTRTDVVVAGVYQFGDGVVLKNFKTAKSNNGRRGVMMGYKSDKSDDSDIWVLADAQSGSPSKAIWTDVDHIDRLDEQPASWFPFIEYNDENRAFLFRRTTVDAPAQPSAASTVPVVTSWIPKFFSQS